MRKENCLCDVTVFDLQTNRGIESDESEDEESENEEEDDDELELNQNDAGNQPNEYK